MKSKIFLAICIIILLGSTTYAGVQKLNGNGTAPYIYIPFDGDVNGEVDNKKLNGDGVRTDFITGIVGKSVIIKRYAYDQKASLSYLDIEIKEKQTIIFFLKPLWNSLDTRNEILNIVNSDYQINFVKNDDNTLTLQFKNKDSVDKLNIKNELNNQNFNKIALFWDFEKYEYGVKINNKIYKSKLENIIKNKTDFLEKQYTLWIGSKYKDNYKGDAGECVYDELKIYNDTFTEEKLSNLWTGDIKETGKLIKLLTKDYKKNNFNDIVSNDILKEILPKGLHLFYTGGQALAIKQLDQDLKKGTINFWAKLSFAKGESRSLIFNLKSENIEHKLFYNPSSLITDLIINTEEKTFKLNQLYKINSDEWNNYIISWNSDIIKFYINGVEQSSVKNMGLILENIEEINYTSGKFDIDKLMIFAEYFDKKDVINLLNICNNKNPVNFTTNNYEEEIWSLDDAQSKETTTRKEICLNGIWRFYPVLNNEFTPEIRTEIFYSKVPGRWLNNLTYEVYKLDENNKLKTVDKIADKNITDYMRGWYSRDIKLSQEYYDKNIFLKIKYLGAHCVRIFVDNELVDTYSWVGRFEQGILNYKYIDISKYNKEKTIRLDIELFFKDDKFKQTYGTSLFDISIDKLDNKIFTNEVLIKTSVKNKTINISGTIINWKAVKGNYFVETKIFEHSSSKLEKELLDLPVNLTGETYQKFNLTAKWENPTLWNPDNPYLYDLKITIKSLNGKVLDESYNYTFGFREFEMGENAFYLNGDKMHLFYNSSIHGELFKRYTDFMCSRKENIYNAVKTLKDMGFNTLGAEINFNADLIEWYKGITPVWQEELIKTCDELGMFVVLWIPEFDELTDKDDYKQAIEKHINFWGNHPSIILYLNDFNKTYYPLQQHPAMINDVTYIPKQKIKTRELILSSDKIVTDYDNTRGVFHNASGNMTKLYTTMHYMSFGLPLQEREDWPYQWSKSKKNLFMDSETGFTYQGQFSDFDNPTSFNDAKILVSEHAARYFGDGIYNIISKDYSKVQNRFDQYRFENNDLKGEYFKIKDLFAKNHITAWRGYGTSGIGVFAEESWFFMQMYDTKWLNNLKYDNLKTYGIKPDKALLEHRFLDINKKTKYYYSLKEALAPIRVVIINNEKYWNGKDHSFFQNETIKKQILILNDSFQTLNALLKVDITDNKEKTIYSFSKNITVQPGEQQMIPYEFKAPDRTAKEKCKISAILKSENKEIAKDTFDFEVFLNEKLDVNSFVAIGLYDTKGDTEKLLKNLNISYKKINNINDLKDIKVLIIGKETLFSAKDNFLAEIEEKQYIENGLNLLIFEQKECNLGNLIFEAERQRYVFIKDKSHPIINGINEDDLRNWRGNPDIIVNFDTPNITRDEISPHYPFFKYTAGSYGIVASYVIRKPISGNFKSILDCGFDLINSPLAEMKKGKGKIILCQLDVTPRYNIDPVATKITNNILKYVCQNNANDTQITLGILDKNNHFEKFIKYASNIQKMDDLKEMDKCNVIMFVDVSEEELLKYKDNIKDYLNKGGNILYINYLEKEGTLDWAPVDIEYKSNKFFKSRVINSTNNIISGLGNSDFFWRSPIKVTEFLTEDKNVVKFLDNNSMIEIGYGNGKLILIGFLPVNFVVKPAMLEGGKKYSSFIDKFVYYKPFRIVNNILNNIGVQFDNSKLFSNDRYMNNKKNSTDILLQVENWKFKIDPDDIGLKENWIIGLSDDTWKEIKLGLTWEDQGYTMLNKNMIYTGEKEKENKYHYDGVAWYKAKIFIPESFEDYDTFILSTGSIDDFDDTFVNGDKIGSTGKETPKWWEFQRKYIIAKKSLKFGSENIIAMRVFDNYMGGRVEGPVNIIIQKVKKDAVFSLSPYPDDYPEYDVNAFHNW